MPMGPPPTGMTASEYLGWRYEVVEAGGRIVLREGLELDVDALYEGVLELPGE